MVTDGLGEAGADLEPHSDFLERLNARPRREGVKYTIIAGNQHPARRMTANGLNEQLRNARRLLSITHMGEVIVAPRAEAFLATISVNRQHVRMLVYHPARRRSGGRTDNHLEVVTTEHVHGPDHPIELQITRARLEFAPGKLAYPNELDSHLSHTGRIALPPLLRPLFGVVADAKGRGGHDTISEGNNGFGLASHINFNGEQTTRDLFGRKLFRA